LVIPIIQDTFPNLTRLDVDIHDNSRNFALLLARNLPNVTWLKLDIRWGPFSSDYNYDTSPYIPETPGGPLASLHVSVTLDSERHGMVSLKNWVIHTVLGHIVGLGGPYLQEVEMVFLTRDTSAAPIA